MASRVYLNNVYRGINDDSSNFTITLPKPIMNAKSMMINSATIENLSYTFDKSESFFFYQAGSALIQSVNLNLKKVYNNYPFLLFIFKHHFLQI